jgi:hypothetical protein
MITPSIGSVPYERFSQLTNHTFITVWSKDLRAAGPFTEIELSKAKGGVTLPQAFSEDSLCFYESSDLTNYLFTLMLQNFIFTFSSQKLLNLHEDITNRVRLFEFDEDALSQLATCQTKAFVGSAEEIEDLSSSTRTECLWLEGRRSFCRIVSSGAFRILRVVSFKEECLS